MKGVGYFLHYHQEYIDFHEQFECCGGISDAYEVLSLHFKTELQSLVDYVSHLGKPICLHTSVMDLGRKSNKQKPGLQLLQEQERAINPLSITEHHAILNAASGDAFGIFFPPPELDEQKDVIVNNVLSLRDCLSSKLLLENPIYSYELVGTQTKKRVEFFNQTLHESNSRMHLSLSNISYSSEYGARIDPDEYLENIDFSLVDQIHIYVNNQEEAKQLPKAYRESEQWLKSRLEQVLKYNDLQPLIFFELEARTAKLAEPEYLRDSMNWARSLIN
ncbi:DUF692 family multinuclear iron-containing protein [Candidatus Sororendozoicomonas aggregata]|uniref:multinuclear nonheme iron-dependent oxidase n=1 Tax=Candidatus Sororendozoicomonas aggregata TaxID=3073239 RepID=UPI002ED0041D